MKKVFTFALLSLALALFSCSQNGTDNPEFSSENRISLPFATLRSLGKISENADRETLSIAGCYTCKDTIEIENQPVDVYLGLQLNDDGHIKSFYASSLDINPDGEPAWYKDSESDVWDVEYSLGTVKISNEEKDILLISDSEGGQIVGVLYYDLDGASLTISDGTEENSITLERADDDGIFDGALDPAADFYGSGTEDDPYMTGWVKTEGAYIKDKLEGCFISEDLEDEDASPTDISLKFGIRFELVKDENGEAVEARIRKYFTRSDFVEDGKNVYSYDDFENPSNKGWLCKFNDRTISSTKKVTNLIMWVDDYKGECCGQIPIYFDEDEEGNITGFWLDSCIGNWATRYDHDGENGKYFYHYVKSNDESVFNGAFDYMDYIKGDKNFY